MFNHRFFLQAPTFDGYVEQANNPPVVGPRFPAFARFAHDLLGWFEANPALQSVKLKCVAIPEVQRAPLSVRIRHHFALTAEGAEMPQANEYALAALPWSVMGGGVFVLDRTHPLVAQYLSLPDDATLSYESVVYTLAVCIDAAFEPMQVIHDVGLRSAT